MYPLCNTLHHVYISIGNLSENLKKSWAFKFTWLDFSHVYNEMYSIQIIEATRMSFDLSKIKVLEGTSEYFSEAKKQLTDLWRFSEHLNVHT